VALIVAEGRSLTWWAGDRAPDPAETAAVVALAAAAQRVVRIADAEDDLGDVLVTSGSAFHVLRLFRPVSGEPQVAHLRLRRGGANLAMARHEFKVLVDRYALGPDPARPRHAAATDPMAGAGPVEAVTADAGPAPLPRRRPSGGANSPPAAADGTTVPRSWISLFGQPFTAEEAILERVLGTLRYL
jgi:hypothetical protein